MGSLLLFYISYLWMHAWYNVYHKFMDAYVHAGECAKQLFPQHCDCQMWALYNGALYGPQSLPPAGTHCSRQPGAKPVLTFNCNSN